MADMYKPKKNGHSCIPGARPDNLALIETMLWEDGGYFLLDLHLERLEKSAYFFSLSFDREIIDTFLKDAGSSFEKNVKYRVRLLLKMSGNPTLTSFPLDPPDKLPVIAAVSTEKVERNDIFLSHKTTNRGLYDRELTKYRAINCFDVIFLNQDDEITEGAISNVIVRKGKRFWTPPLSSGLLPGVYREHLLKTGEIPLKEKVLHKEDLLNADEVFLINSVRKKIPAVIKPPVQRSL